MDAANSKTPGSNVKDKDQAAPEVAVAEAEHSRPPIFKLNIFCYKDMAEWLSLEDLHSFGQTCKPHHQVAGYIFNEMYPESCVECREDGIYIGDVQVNGFCDYVERVSVKVDNMNCFRFIESHSFASLKEVRLDWVNLTDEKIACMKKVLNKVETVCVSGKLDGEFHSKFLRFCVNMKRLTLQPTPCERYSSWNPDHDCTGIVIGTSNDWLLRVYPKLKNFQFGDCGCFYPAPRELKIFRQQNQIKPEVGNSQEWLDYSNNIPENILKFMSDPKSTKLRIGGFCSTDQGDKLILDLPAWNGQRAKLARAQKFTIYVPEQVYLATKWAIHKTDYKFIELKREQSWDRGFGLLKIFR